MTQHRLKRSRFRLPRWIPTSLTTVAVMAVVTSISVPAQALPAPQTAPRFEPPPAGSAVRPVTGVQPVPRYFTKAHNDAASSQVAKPAVWPEKASERLTLPGDNAAAKVRGAKTLVWAQQIGKHTQPVAVDVQMHDRATAQQAGAAGAVFTVTLPSGADAVATRVGLDYSGFASAYGGNFGSRLKLVQLPQCALTTPQQAQCRRATPLRSSNDVAAQTVSAQLDWSKSTSGSQSVVLAATTTGDTGGGAAGTFGATELSAEGSWTAGGSAGVFGYTYPLGAPSAPAGVVPKLVLSYSSNEVDGKTAATSSQSSWAGDGWSLPESYIEQSFVSCTEEPEGTPDPTPTNDLCYDGPILTLSLNGSTAQLVWDSTKSVWKTKDDNGSVISHVTNSGNGSGTYNTDYWTLTERNGTVYSFGLNHLPGWTADKPATNSVDSVPVYSSHSGDPCFALSWCVMAYRWRLDYVKDLHNRAMAYYYKQDLNYYGRNQGATNTQYVRGSYPDRIDYGFADGNAYGTVANQVVFGTGDRCVTAPCQPLNQSTKANWPDVPFDLICASGGTCPWAPSFFSTVRLASVTTQQYVPAQAGYRPIDSWTLNHTMPATADGTSPTLWLDSITHTGNDTSGGGSATSITLPSTTFASVKLPNRVDFTTSGYPSYARHRIQSIKTETGSTISVTYDRPAPCAVPVTIDPVTNTSSCYPVKWTPSGAGAPIDDWFNKYVVTKVTQDDPVGGAPAVSTSYRYPDGAAWHFDENELVKAKYRTYGQFRGYGRVQTLSGDGSNDRQTLSETRYHRGMSKNNSATVVNLIDSQGGSHEDLDELAGMVLEQTAYRGDGGAADSLSISSYWVGPATASRSRTGLPDLAARRVAPVYTFARQAITSSGATNWRASATDTSYDTDPASPTYGLTRYVYTHTLPADPAYDRCAGFTYAAPNTSRNLVGLVSEGETVSKACAGYVAGSPPSVPGSVNSLSAAAGVSRPAQVVSATRTFFDDPTFATTFPQPSAPTKGEATMVRRAADYSGGAYVWQTVGRTAFDGLGRVVETYDGNGNRTQTGYTANSVGLTTGSTIKDPNDHTTSTTINPMRALMTTSTDLNGVVTTKQHDALGRTTSVWLYSRPTTDAADLTYTYTVSDTAPNAITTNRLNDALGYRTSTVIYDGLLRPRQTQSLTPQGGRLITDNFYDSRSWVRATYNGWWDNATLPNTTIVSATDLGKNVDNQTLYTYDGLGRAVYVKSAKDNVVISTTTTVYNGDRVTYLPPTGGVAQTTFSDPLGRTNRVDQFKTLPTLNTPADTFTGAFSVTGGAAVSLTYGFDTHDNPSTTTTSGSTWSATYNLLGQVTAVTDPDAGTTTGVKYDSNGNLTEATDSRGMTVSATYDKLNRRTAVFASTVAAQVPYGQPGANQVTKQVYDNSDGAITSPTYVLGHETSTTSYAGGSAYTVRQKNFNKFGESTGIIVSIPTAEGTQLGKDWAFDRTYSANTGLPQREIYPIGGGLPSESVLHTYDSLLELPKGLTGLAQYAQTSNYDAYWRATQTVIGTSPHLSTLTYTYDPHTSRVMQQTLTREGGATDFADQQDYTYDLSGNVIKQKSTRWGNAANSETQCYTYDKLARLTDAWTATDNCTTAPTTANHSMVGNTLGTNSAYWTSWAVDDAGNRTGQTQHNLGTGADTITGYTLNGNGAGQPHTLTATSGDAGGATSYSYDTAGNMTGRTTPLLGNQTLSFDQLGRLTQTVTVKDVTTKTTRYVYDAHGNMLLQKDPGTTVLYLPGQQITLNTSTGTTTGARYYGLPGGVTAVRTGSSTNYGFTISDAHGTAALRLDNTAQTPTWRQFTPYGAARGTTGSWIDNRGFLDQPVNPTTGLNQVGARNYDPDTGRFISRDPVIDVSDSQQLNGYNYTDNNPITYSDPSGLMREKLEGDQPYQGDAALGMTFGSENAGGKQRVAAIIKSQMCGGGINPQYCGKWKDMDKQAQDEVVFQTWCQNNPHACGEYHDAVQASVDAVFEMALVGAASIALDIIAIAVPVAEPELLGAEAAVEGAIIAREETLIAKVEAEAAEAEAAIAKLEATMVRVEAAAARTETEVIAVETETATVERTATKTTTTLRPPPARTGNGCHSFDPDTPVLMADGSTKAIKDVEIGDQVLATDPATGRTQSKEVTVLHRNRDRDLAELTIRDDATGRSTVLKTTWHHPFWDATNEQWVNAADLRPGTHLRDDEGMETQRVVGVRTWVGLQEMRDLTVANVHTYYVLAGDTPVLVHNIDENRLCDLTLGPGPFAREGVALPGGNKDAPGVQELTNQSGDRWGCHTCGEMSPGTSAKPDRPMGDWITDHQGATKLVSGASFPTYQTGYPHCWPCARQQAGAVTQINRGNYEFPPVP